MSTAQKLPSMASSIHNNFLKINEEITFDQVSDAVQASFSGIDLDDYESIKRANGTFHQFIKDLGVDIKRTALLNLVSKSLGSQNHHVLKAKNASDAQKSNGDHWYDFEPGRISVIVGGSGAGKSLLLTQCAPYIDSYDSLMIDFGLTHAPETIKTMNERYGTDHKGFKKAKYIDLGKKGVELPSGQYKKIVIDEAFTVSRLHHDGLVRLISNNRGGHVILVLQSDADLHEFGLEIDLAERVFENLGRTNFESYVKVYQFNRKHLNKSTQAYEKIKKVVKKGYLDDVMRVYHETQSVEFAIKVAKIAQHLKREPSIISRSKNFDKVFDFYMNSMDRDSDLVKSQMIRDINSGLNAV